MKKQYLFLIATALVAMVACSKSDLEEPAFKPETGGDVPQTITIHASLPADGRAIHGTEENETSFSWVAGEDQIGVSIKNDEWWEYSFDPCAYRFTNTTNGEKATFVSDPLFEDDLPNVQVGSTIVSYYPYGTATFRDYVNEETIGQPMLRNSLGALLQIGNNTTDHLYRGDYMFSRPVTLTEEHFDSEGNVNVALEFGHIFAKMRFTVKNSTSQTIDISSLIYRSTNEEDIMQGTLYLNAATGEFVTPEYEEWGDIRPSNSSVLEVQDVTIAPGETATLWMWMMPLDFTEGNAAGRKADIMVNTQLGVFRVQNTNFNTRFVAGNVYRQGFELTEEKLLADYAYVSDPNFVDALYFGNQEGEMYDENGNFIGGSYCTLYDLDLQPYAPFDGQNWEGLMTGCFIKISECATLKAMNIAFQMVNALSLDGLQYFTGLVDLNIDLGRDSDPAMSLRALKFGTLTNLESFNILMTRAPILDFSANTKLQSIALGEAPMLEKIIGLDKLVNLKSFGIGEPRTGLDLDLSVCPSLKSVSIYAASKTMGSLNLSNLTLDLLTIDMSNIEVLNSTNLSCTKLENVSGKAFPSGAPASVKELFLWAPYNTASMCTQFDQMNEIEYLFFSGNFSDLVFTPAQASVKELEIYCNEGTNLPSGWSNLTGTERLAINEGSLRGEWDFAELDLSGMTSLKTASILTNRIESFKAPASLTDLDLTIQNSLSFNPPAALANLTLNSVRGSITLGDGAGIKSLYLIGEAGQDQPAITLGAYPLLESLIVDTGSYGVVSFGAASYPALKSYKISYGKRITSIPSASVLPNLESLTMSNNVGIRTLDLRAYTSLKNLSVYESNFGSGAITISPTQRDYAQANGAEEVFTSITQDSVSSIYKVSE